MSITIKQIANAAGVSRGTVDRVLHNRPGVRSDVAELIREIARQKGYIPNRAGKVLAARKQALSFGCLLPSIGNPFFDDIIFGLRKAEKELSDFGISVHIEQIKGFDEQVHICALEKLLNAGYAGLCLTTIDVPEVQVEVQKIISKGIPVISVNTDIPDTNRLCYVGPDYYSAGKTAAGMLSFMARESLQLLIATGSFFMRGHNERIRGFVDELRNLNVDYSIVHTFESLDDNEIAYKKTLELLKLKPEINCIFIAAAGVEGVCEAVETAGKERCPYVLAFDDILSTKEYVKKGLIHFLICQDPVQQGYTAINKLFSYLMDAGHTNPDDFITDTIIKIRANI